MLVLDHEKFVACLRAFQLREGTRVAEPHWLTEGPKSAALALEADALRSLHAMLALHDCAGVGFCNLDGTKVIHYGSKTVDEIRC